METIWKIISVLISVFTIFSSLFLPVPKVSTMMEVGSATPMA